MDIKEFEDIARDLVEIKRFFYKNKMTDDQMHEKLEVLGKYIDRITQASCETNVFELDGMLLKLEIEVREVRENIRLAVNEK